MKESPNPDAKVDPSPTKNGDDPTQQGKAGAHTPSLENLVGENKRLSKELKELKESYENAELSREDLLAEIEEIKRTLGDKSGNVDDLSKIKSDPQNRTLIRLIESMINELSPNHAKSTFWEEQKQEVEDLVGETAEELKVEAKALRNSLQSYAVKYRDYTPVRRTKLAIRDFKADQSRIKTIEEREKALKEKEEANKLYREIGGSRTPQQETAHQKLKSAKNMEELGDALTQLINVR